MELTEIVLVAIAGLLTAILFLGILALLVWQHGKQAEQVHLHLLQRRLWELGGVVWRNENRLRQVEDKVESAAEDGDLWKLG